MLCYSCFNDKPDGAAVCPFCGYDSTGAARYPMALREGSVLAGRYIVGRVLGQGGFGITYVAQEHRLNRLVAIKEYFPDTLALRVNKTAITAYTDERAESFQYGKKCFIEEAETLSKFIDNENICKIYSFFEENGTAYFAMEYIAGESLLQHLKHNGGRISVEEAKRILFPIMDALGTVHAKGIIHRDVSPDNIILTYGGAVKLLDFGAARYSLGDRSRSLDVVLKHGYAPREQYTRHGRQGPYTDVYSLGATFYRAITGRIPPDSIDRMDEDIIILPSVLGVAISKQDESALMKALAVNPYDRFPSMAEFKEAFIQNSRPIEPVSIPQSAVNSTVHSSEQTERSEQTTDEETLVILPDTSSSDPVRKASSTWRLLVVGAAIMALIAVTLILIFIPRDQDDDPTEDSEPTNTITIKPTSAPVVPSATEYVVKGDDSTTAKNYAEVVNFILSNHDISNYSSAYDVEKMTFDDGSYSYGCLLSYCGDNTSPSYLDRTIRLADRINVTTGTTTVNDLLNAGFTYNTNTVSASLEPDKSESVDFEYQGKHFFALIKNMSDKKQSLTSCVVARLSVYGPSSVIDDCVSFDYHGFNSNSLYSDVCTHLSDPNSLIAFDTYSNHPEKTDISMHYRNENNNTWIVISFDFDHTTSQVYFNYISVYYD